METGCTDLSPRQERVTEIRSSVSETLAQERVLQPLLETEAELRLRSDLPLLPLATSFVEKASGALGLAQPEALALTLATEEIFTYLCQVAVPGKELRILCRSGGYYVEAEFVFEPQDLNLRAFNITCSPSLHEPECLETGLLIASRMVDRFQFLEDEKGFRLILTKEKTYPASAEIRIPESKPLKQFSIRLADPEELKIFVRMVTDHYVPPFVPMSFAHPGKVVDMVATGKYNIILAVDAAGHIGGGLIWRWETNRLVGFYGPYLLNQPLESGMARALVDACISLIARTRATGLISRYPTQELPLEYFEPLGFLTFRHAGGTAQEITAYYRHLEEDVGLSVWSHPSLEPFLTAEYRRLFFAREINMVRNEGEAFSLYSVLSSGFDRGSGRVTLYPMWLGTDAHEVLASHVTAILNENIANILFEMDIGKAWQCHFTPALLESGFQPRLVLPYAGKGDRVVFQHERG